MKPLRRSMMKSWMTACMINGQILACGTPQDTKTILELACGTGIQAVRFAQKGYEVTGLDLSYEMLELAQKSRSCWCHDGTSPSRYDGSERCWRFRRGDLLLGQSVLYGRPRSRFAGL